MTNKIMLNVKYTIHKTYIIENLLYSFYGKRLVQCDIQYLQYDSVEIFMYVWKSLCTKQYLQQIVLWKTLCEKS